MQTIDQLSLHGVSDKHRFDFSLLVYSLHGPLCYTNTSVLSYTGVT